ncbi:hypothetical protein AK812_SmicGene624 [Symbiodinium microadriaticum]|uniref:Uncharacterized protein n=1 Tax=Symbiodinium microadriaticum TaxID=2951 RepID=A0A1Q9F684_SYMMI|nr:hypothetical protein AK812_SmicGene624 [Symbiodinium microadriaticum]
MVGLTSGVGTEAWLRDRYFLVLAVLTAVYFAARRRIARLLWKSSFLPNPEVDDEAAEFRHAAVEEKVGKHAHCRRFSAVPMGDDEPDPSSLEIVPVVSQIQLATGLAWLTWEQYFGLGWDRAAKQFLLIYVVSHLVLFLATRFSGQVKTFFLQPSSLVSLAAELPFAEATHIAIFPGWRAAILEECHDGAGLKDCDLEAACARALDITSDVRIPVLFHADDPVFLASSRGEANRVLSIVRSAEVCRAELGWKLCVSLARWKTQVAKHVMPLKYLSIAQDPKKGLSELELVRVRHMDEHDGHESEEGEGRFYQHTCARASRQGSNAINVKVPGILASLLAEYSDPKPG